MRRFLGPMYEQTQGYGQSAFDFVTYCPVCFTRYTEDQRARMMAAFVVYYGVFGIYIYYSDLLS